MPQSGHQVVAVRSAYKDAVSWEAVGEMAGAAEVAVMERTTEMLPPPPPLPPHSKLRPLRPPPSRLPPPPPFLSRQRLPRPLTTGPRPIPIDREKTCPLLLRVFTKIGGHHEGEDFAMIGQEPKNEFQIYTWKDATLRELTELVKEVTLEARRRDARLSFAFVYPHSHTGRFRVKMVGQTFSDARRERLDDALALAELGFVIGDYLDVAIL